MMQPKSTTPPPQRVPLEAPPCYGTGVERVPVRRFVDLFPMIFDWRQVPSAECFTCPHERRCLQQISRARRRS